MKNQIKIKTQIFAVCTLGMLSAASEAAPNSAVQTFAPKNTRTYSAEAQALGQGITKEDFNRVLDQVKAYYAPVIKKSGRNLYIARKWNDDTVNASAMQFFTYDIINMYGGLARHPMMTSDGFMLVACHETGHHIGGAPKVDGNSWASNEGQSDYFGTLQCLKNILVNEDNVKAIEGKNVDPLVVARCERVYDSAQSQALCQRLALAGHVLGNVLGDLRGTGEVNFNTPDTSVVEQTDDAHPAAQCRLDTYFAGALCDMDPTIPLSKINDRQGVCFQGDGHEFGARPSCWYKSQY